MTFYIIGIAIGLLINIIIAVYKYGKLNERVLDNTKEIDDLKNNTKNVDSMESRIVSLERLHEEVRNISATLNQLVGKLDIFLQLYENKE